MADRRNKIKLGLLGSTPADTSDLRDDRVTEDLEIIQLIRL